jgi:DNA-binding XRE family transcriptional regulator
MAGKSTFAELRARKGVSQNAVARALEVTPGTVVNIEKGRQLPRVDLAQRIAAYFGVSTDDILWLIPEPGHRVKESAA